MPADPSGGDTGWEHLQGCGAGTQRLTIAVNYGKQQFQVVLCLLHQVPTLLDKRERKDLGIDPEA